MKFILNFSFEPHFCALFDAQNVLVDSLEWMDFKTGGHQVWEFLRKHQIWKDQDLDFIGGVSGPGGFSTLRVGGAILNALAFRFDLPVHSARADRVAQVLLESDNFLLNSFGNGVFMLKNGNLERVEVGSAVENFQQKPVFVDWLPETKAQKFTALKSDKDVVMTTFEALKQSKPVNIFLPNYEFPAVQLA